MTFPTARVGRTKEPAAMADDPGTPPPADPTPVEPPKGATPEPPNPDPAPSDPDPNLGDAGKKAIADERKARRDAENREKALAAKLKEFEDRDKTEAEKLAEAKTRAEQEAATSKAELVRLRIAVKHGISEEDMDLLGSGTEQEIEDRATRLAAKNAASAAPGTPVQPQRLPVEQLKPGATPAAPVIADDAYPSSWLSPAKRAAIDARTP